MSILGKTAVGVPHKCWQTCNKKTFNIEFRKIKFIIYQMIQKYHFFWNSMIHSKHHYSYVYLNKKTIKLKEIIKNTKRWNLLERAKLSGLLIILHWAEDNEAVSENVIIEYDHCKKSKLALSSSPSLTPKQWCLVTQVLKNQKTN